MFLVQPVAHDSEFNYQDVDGQVVEGGEDNRQPVLEPLDGGDVQELLVVLDVPTKDGFNDDVGA